MCAAVHRHGALAGIELHHGGARSRSRGVALAAASGRRRSPTRLSTDATAPKEMELRDIRRVQRDWVRRGGAGEGCRFRHCVRVRRPQLPAPAVPLAVLNQRTDAYGGTLENRARFWLETLELVREAVGSRLRDRGPLRRRRARPVGRDHVRRDSASSQMADHLVDLWDITIGPWRGWRGSIRRRRGSSREGYELEWTHEVRAGDRQADRRSRAVHEPGHDGRARRAAGSCDLIGAARPSIADPFLPRKIEEGRYDEIRECIGCNFCYSRSEYGGHLGCTQNATAGEEYRRGWHPERVRPGPRNADRDVLVVGAGPAGMECAIVLAKRGFGRVHLVEAAARSAGSPALDPASFPGSASGAGSSAGERSSSQRLRKNVEVVTGVTIGPDDALDYGAELVVVATGSRVGRRRPERLTRSGRSRAPTPTSPGCSRPSRSWSRASGPRAGVWSCTTARGTSWAPGSPSCSARRATRSCWRHRTSRSRPSARRLSSDSGCAGGCTRSACR